MLKVGAVVQRLEHWLVKSGVAGSNPARSAIDRKCDMITQIELRELLHYDPHTGIFTHADRKWHRKYYKGKRVGKAVGSDDGRGYLRATVKYKVYKLHRLAWLYMTGVYPDHQINFANGNKKDLRWRNLRKASHQSNHHKMKMFKNNTTGYKGVTPNKRDGGYRAQIGVNCKNINLGNYSSPEEAHLAYLRARDQLFILD